MVTALGFLALAKLTTVYVPLVYKQMVDLFADPGALPVVLPLGLLMGYGLLRILQIAFAELRDWVFARVAQHAGLGRALVDEAARLARAAGFADLAVISAVGTRAYYRGLGFCDGALYQHFALATD